MMQSPGLGKLFRLQSPSNLLEVIVCTDLTFSH